MPCSAGSNCPVAGLNTVSDEDKADGHARVQHMSINLYHLEFVKGVISRTVRQRFLPSYVNTTQSVRRKQNLACTGDLGVWPCFVHQLNGKIDKRATFQQKG